MTLYDSYPKCKMTLLKLNEAESNTIEQEQTPIRKPGYPRRVKQCVFKFRSLTPSSIYVARLYLFVKSRVFQSKLVWSVPKVVVYRTKPRLAKPVRPVRPVKKPVEQNETAIIKSKYFSTNFELAKKRTKNSEVYNNKVFYKLILRTVDVCTYAKA